MLYTQKALDHYYNPRNVGEIESADASAQEGEPGCGDTIRVWIRVREERLEQVTFKAFGCPAVIACCSMMTEMATGLTLNEARSLNDDMVVLALDGLPEEKLHCSVFAASVLHAAIDNYEKSKSPAVQEYEI
ncbi:MAG: iron-sulfur cluster assembly scaffold protein [Planctomycetes bacterium]|nr:iron-sulfur cluster assembly scaffold protein [Planctomycetota bacterium]